MDVFKSRTSKIIANAKEKFQESLETTDDMERENLDFERSSFVSNQDNCSKIKANHLENKENFNQKIIPSPNSPAKQPGNTPFTEKCLNDPEYPVENSSLADGNIIGSEVAEQGCSKDIYKVSFNAERPTLLHLKKLPENKYYISPIHSDESDVDDSDADPNYMQGSSSSSESNSEARKEPDPIQSTDKPLVNEEEKKGKKRKSRPNTWNVKKTKLLRNSGKPYVSSSKTKKEFPARTLRPTCGDKCRLKCSLKLNQTDREKIFSSYWKLGDLQKQREFIVVYTEVIKPKYRYSSTQDFRSMNNAFYFFNNGNRIRVCKTFFKATLDINDRPIRTALKKKDENGFLCDDLRGKHGNQPSVEPEIKNSVRNFINSIPRMESHYLRAQTTREYIEGGRSLADIYRDYKEDRESQQLPFANSIMFNRIFNGEFNISFFSPKKDQCDLCESFKNADEQGKENLLEAYNLHIKEKELSRKEKEKDKNNSNATFVAVYDLQAVMPVPKGEVSSFYYKSKLNCYNFTISDLNVKNVSCYFWNETEGKRGAVEIGSCVLKYLQTLIEKNNLTTLDVIFYSDNCGGQQKNKYLLAAYLYAVTALNISSITHKFLITGHTQNEGDNVHSVIEKQIKRHLKASPIYIPEQYATIIRTAKKSGTPYNVIQLTFEDFFDLKLLQEEMGSNFSINTENSKVNWNDIKIIKVKKESPKTFFYKTSYQDDTFKEVNITKTKKTRSTAEPEMRLVKAYTNRFPLAENKKKDLKELVNKNIIPKSYNESFF